MKSTWCAFGPTFFKMPFLAYQKININIDIPDCLILGIEFKFNSFYNSQAWYIIYLIYCILYTIIAFSSAIKRANLT